jgi:hypothetical protein
MIITDKLTAKLPIVMTEKTLLFNMFLRYFFNEFMSCF